MKHRHSEIAISFFNNPRPVELLTDSGWWVDITNPSWNPILEYRFKPQIIQYRRYIFTVGEECQIGTAMTEDDVRWIEESGLLIEWVDNSWQEYEVGNKTLDFSSISCGLTG